MRIGLLTGGGDAPGLNGIIEAVWRTLQPHGHSLIGICDGFEGVFEGRTRNLTANDVGGIHAIAGTVLGTSNRVGTAGREALFLERYRALELDALIVAGGDGTFAGLRSLGASLNLVGVPKTIDNDLSGTDRTFGWDTACAVVADAVDSLRTTAHAHRRVLVVETMGRYAGWIALGGGVAAMADAILIPERPYDAARLANFVKGRHSTQRSFIAVVAEGARATDHALHVARSVEGSPDPVRLGGIGAFLANWLEAETGWEARHVVLGHLQRAHGPSPSDRRLTAALGVEAAMMAMEGAFDQAAVMRQGLVARVPISELMAPARTVPSNEPLLQVALSLGIFV
ncbi:MAG: ATP-dependent 6-phosphofructokinase [Myxococcales bacterium]|nr:ATP-dependent 6-phosphofructokinase [Myxococcales bacterium]